MAAKYTIGPWKLFGGYEHIHYTNPDNPLAPGAFQSRAATTSPSRPTTPICQTDKVLQIFWVGVKYAVTPDLDVMGSYYGYRQNSFLSRRS